jgi:hypothetical protein
MKRSLLLFTLIFLHPALCHAVLGEMAEPIGSAQRMPSGFSARAEIHEAYTVRTVQSETTTVREFVAPSGIVFAVAWNGITQPDLSILLGSYNDDYQSTLNRENRARGRRIRSVRANRVIVEHWGQMRNLSGRAYDPSLVPGGVSLEEIQ